MKKERAKTSPIWKSSVEEFKEIVANSKTIREIFSHFGLTNKGSNYKTLSNRIIFENIDTSHLKKSMPPVVKGIRPLRDILIENCSYNRSNLKRRLLSEKLIEYICADCGLVPYWNNKKLCLQLDHKNGISNDNRLDNLQFLCPNCHSQTDSFAGKNKRYIVIHAPRDITVPLNSTDVRRYSKKEFCKIDNLCLDCNKKIRKTSKRCLGCASQMRRGLYEKIIWPSSNDLLESVNKFGFVKTGKILGVSDNAVKKRLKLLKLI